MPTIISWEIVFKVLESVAKNKEHFREKVENRPTLMRLLQYLIRILGQYVSTNYCTKLLLRKAKCLRNLVKRNGDSKIQEYTCMTLMSQFPRIIRFRIF